MLWVIVRQVRNALFAIFVVVFAAMWLLDPSARQEVCRYLNIVAAGVIVTSFAKVVHDGL
jgi:preprotein translocase subunit SecE